jgi:hypothetical protein
MLAPTARAEFGLRPGSEGFAFSARNKDTTEDTKAGTHPYVLRAHLALNTAGAGSDGDLRDFTVHLPPGFLVNPAAVSECSAADFATPRSSPYEASSSGESCQNAAQVGTVALDVGGVTRTYGLFALIPAFGNAAALGASPFGTPLIFNLRLRESDYGFDLDLAEVPQSFDLQSLDLTIWGTPWEGGSPTPAGHNPQRGNCLNEQTGGSYGECLVNGAVPAPPEQIKSYVTMPTVPCGQPFTVSVDASSWQGTGAQSSQPLPALSACNKPLANVQVQLMNDRAASRTGLAVNIPVNDGGGILNPAGIARPPIKQTELALPSGLTINPSLGAGLGTCTEAQFATEAATSEEGAGCPNAAKIGTVTLEGELGLAEPMQGSVYVATPYQNPYHALIGLYMVGRNARRGLLVKSIGELVPDPGDGRLVATFDQLPRILYQHFSLSLREGLRSTLVSPPTCGTYTAQIAFSSWAEPSVFRHEQSAFAINRGDDGGPCPAAGQPFHPVLLAGSLNAAPGVYTPFYLRMTRTDAEQEITSYSATFPPGLLAKLAGVTDCPDATIEAARAKTGIEELEHPSCPASSRIGHTAAGYGVGGTLAYAPGGLYLAGPYHGAPLSTVAIDSALVGPFDLGTVIVRSAIRVDARTAQASIDSSGSDPIPHILKGIPLHLRDIRVYLDRPEFTRNPTSCDKLKTSSLLTGAGSDVFSPADDVPATSAQRFQLLGCSALDFKPKLGFSLRGAPRRGAYPALRSELRARPRDANLSAVAVTLPASEFIAQEHLRNVCSRAQFAAEQCPSDSVYGHARAFTPLLDEPLEGSVYLRSSGKGLPDIVFDLHGRGGLHVEVPGKIDSVHSSLRATFTELPDAPVSKFVLTMKGASHGLLQNEKNPCSSPQHANVRMIGQNHLGEATKPLLATKCAGAGKKQPAGHRSRKVGR